MSKETHQISDIIPMAIEGEFSLEGQFSLNRTHSSTIADLFCMEYELTSDFGRAACTMLGQKHYFAVGETYRYKEGLICSTRLTQPLIGLYFQLEGSAQDIQSSMDLDLDIFPGEANLMIIPPLNESFELKKSLGGRSFTIVLSKDYLENLSDRFPHILEPILTKVNQRELCMFKKENVRITPRMRAAIQRIQNHDNDHLAGSLFLEA